MYAGDELLAADDDAFGPFAEFDPFSDAGDCEHGEVEDLDDTGRADRGRCVDCGVVVLY